MKHISSRDNSLFKRLARLAAGKTDIEGKHHVLLEGIHLCQAWMEHQGAPLRAIFDVSRLAQDAELQALARSLEAELCVSCDERLARNLSQVEHGQGVYFEVIPPRHALPDLIDHNCIWLDRVQDPGNVGTLLRTAAAAGIGHAYLSRGTAGAWSAKVLRSAQGAHFSLAIHENVDLLQAFDRLAIPLAVTTLGQACSLYEARLPQACAWVLGNEGHGVSHALLQLAGLRVFIPQAAGVESLNVAVAAGICLFEQRRRFLQHSEV